MFLAQYQITDVPRDSKPERIRTCRIKEISPAHHRDTPDSMHGRIMRNTRYWPVSSGTGPNIQETTMIGKAGRLTCLRPSNRRGHIGLTTGKPTCQPPKTAYSGRSTSAKALIRRFAPGHTDFIPTLTIMRP